MATIPPPVAPSRPTGSLIVNSPFEPPAYHWTEENGRLTLRPGRRPADPARMAGGREVSRGR